MPGAQLVLSASSVAAYQTCHYRWRLEYIEMHSSVMGLPAAIGQAVHSGVEAWYKGFLMGVADPALLKVAHDVLRTTFIFETASMADPEEPLDKALVQAQRVLQSYIEDVASITTPVLIEYGFLLSINGILFSGHLDLADNERKVRDLKVKKTKPRNAKELYGFSRVGYALGYRDATGEEESDFQLDVMIRLKRDRPYHVPFSTGPVTPGEIGVFAATLERTAEGIARGDFRPTGLGISCRYCPVKHACEYGLALEEQNATA
jgi:hypothetical protein